MGKESVGYFISSAETIVYQPGELKIDPYFTLLTKINTSWIKKFFSCSTVRKSRLMCNSRMYITSTIASEWIIHKPRDLETHSLLNKIYAINVVKTASKINRHMIYLEKNDNINSKQWAYFSNIQNVLTN